MRAHRDLLSASNKRKDRIRVLRAKAEALTDARVIVARYKDHTFATPGERDMCRKIDDALLSRAMEHHCEIEVHH